MQALRLVVHVRFAQITHRACTHHTTPHHPLIRQSPTTTTTTTHHTRPPIHPLLLPLSPSLLSHTHTTHHPHAARHSAQHIQNTPIPHTNTHATQHTDTTGPLTDKHTGRQTETKHIHYCFCDENGKQTSFTLSCKISTGNENQTCFPHKIREISVLFEVMNIRHFVFVFVSVAMFPSFLDHRFRLPFHEL